MRKSIILLLIFCFVLTFASCKNDEQEIKDLIIKYQNALNENDKDKISNLFEDPDDLYLSFIILDSYREQGIIAHYKFDILKIEIYDSIAEAKLKERVTLSGDDPSTIAALNLFIPSVATSTMTLSKDSGEWKIVSDDLEEY